MKLVGLSESVDGTLAWLTAERLLHGASQPSPQMKPPIAESRVDRDLRR